MTGDHRSPLRTARRVVAPHGASGRMISAPAGLAVVIPPRGRRVRNAAPYPCPRALYEQKLITQEEYERKRQEILKEL